MIEPFQFLGGIADEVCYCIMLIFVHFAGTHNHSSPILSLFLLSGNDGIGKRIALCKSFQSLSLFQHSLYYEQQHI